MTWSVGLSTGAGLVCTFVGYIACITYDHRRKINQLRKQGIPMPKEWNWLFGHLMVLQKYVDGIPPDAAVAFAMRDLAQEFSDTEIFLMDFWPVYPPLLTVFGPETISQVCNKYDLPKTATTSQFMMPIAGGPNLVSMNGEEWKYWRSMFNPGFSTGAMLNNVPHIVDSVLVFREKLLQRIDKGMFPLDELTSKLTMEIILKVTLDHDTDYQKSPNTLATALDRITSWHSFWDPRILMNPIRPFVQRYYGSVMNRYIRAELDKRFQEAKQQILLGLDERNNSKSSKSIITLALQAYFADQKDLDTQQQKNLYESFAEYSTWQIRVFLFAGTDSTASIMVYIYHMMSKHSQWLDRIRQEHNQVFGRDPADAAHLLKENPSLLNNCKLTLAFIKETLRLYSPAGSVRSGMPGVTITDLQGNQQPMEYAGANILHQALHLNPRVWPRAAEFLPERFLVEEGHELHPDPAAFRPLEQGSRNCIGQTLVWNELRIAAILTCRDLYIRDAYHDLDHKREREMTKFGKWKQQLFGAPMRTLHGERAYKTDTGGLHPVDGYPCYVSRVGQ